MSIVAEPLEAIITEALLLRVDSPALAQTLAEQAATASVDHTGDLTGIENQLEQLDRDFYVEELIDRKRWLTMKRELEDRRDHLLADVATQTRTTALEGYTTPGVLRKAWPDLTVDQQRVILTSVIDHVTVAPAVRSGRKFDSSRVDITWLV
jgi:hypothetical protein